DQIHNFAHNNEWLIRNLDFLGQHHRAADLARNMISLPRLAKFKTEDKKEVYDPSGSSWQYGRQRLRDTLVRYEDWRQVIALSGDGKDKTAPLHPDGQSITDTDYHRYVGLAKFESGDLAGAGKHLAELEKRLEAKRAEKDKAVAAAEKKATEAKKDAKGIEESKKAAAKNFEKAVTDLENPVNELRVYAALSASPPDTAKALELLPKLKDLAKWRHASLWQRAGKGEEAIKLANEAVSSGKNEVLPLVSQVRLLHANGDKEKAREAFTRLRTVASGADADLPVFLPLVAIAKEFGFPQDWRLAPEAPKDLGERPELDSLGPFRWTPPQAPSATVTAIDGTSEPLFTMGGRPRVVIFFLGKGCSHCMEQLNAFAPVGERYKEAGIDLVAVSTDTAEGLKETLAGEGEEKSPFPFPLYSDADLAAFKAFRAHDDFEEMPLHGTYLIDRGGRIRWQEISYEPFMKPEWLLEECVRLLALDSTES
ncbi:MAG: redoxin domain-containing protein, partial [Verrucomicrobiae bacterium]|nr:redoxin domain-containing protein [Verrucomicrobiae bacterium]